MKSPLNAVCVLSLMCAVVLGVSLGANWRMDYPSNGEKLATVGTYTSNGVGPDDETATLRVRVGSSPQGFEGPQTHRG